MASGKRRSPKKLEGGSHQVLTVGFLQVLKAGSPQVLEELEFEAPLESVDYVSLGDFRIPLAIRVSDDVREPPIWVRVKFSLLAEVDPQDRKAVNEALKRYDGPLRDAVIRICRRTTPDELSDPRLSAMKARFADAAKPLLGDRRLRQLIIDKFIYEPL